MSNFTRKDLEHLKRLSILIVMVVGGLALLRLFFIPKDFGLYGYYRASSIEENMERQQNYAGAQSCADCHEDKYILWSKSKHQTVTCETCHGALLKHTEDPTSVIPDKPQGRKFCALCHEENFSRPAKFPQINLARHNPGLDCKSCHDPHNPRLAN